MTKKIADVCLILEGTYPYVKGGVSSWTHQLINAQKHLSFHIVAILPPKFEAKILYDVPDNVIKITNIWLQDLPKQRFSFRKLPNQFFHEIELPLLNLQITPNLEQLNKILKALRKYDKQLSKKSLLDSQESWDMLLRMYNSTVGNTCFLDFFWTWRALLGGLFSILTAPLPKAKVYHSLCTGYAGLYLARASIEQHRPCLVTEHGIYTNERRIEIAAAEWLDSQKALDLNVNKPAYEITLRDFWINNFTSYSKMCYEACDEIITIYEGNTYFQKQDGALESKISVIPNGINYEKFSKLKKEDNEQPTIALIGRVVPIKNIKIFIRSCSILKDQFPNLRAYIMGPRREDKAYYQECLELIAHHNIEDIITFTGLVDLTEYLPKVDVAVLTSISEAQPLVILEAGCLGIPSVVTDVGACHEMLFGTSSEKPNLGQAGIVCPLSDPNATASAIQKLLIDKDFYDQCSKNIKKRVEKYYNKEALDKKYKEIYATYIKKKDLKKKAA